jgi:hypothetical protein
MLLLASSGSISLLGGMGGMVQNVKGGENYWEIALV